MKPEDDKFLGKCSGNPFMKQVDRWELPVFVFVVVATFLGMVYLIIERFFSK